MRSIRTKSIATEVNNPYSQYFSPGSNSELRQVFTKDTLLQTVANFGGTRAIEAYLDIITDDAVFSAYDKQVSDILDRNFHVEAGGESDIDKLCAEKAQEMLENLHIVDQKSKEGYLLSPTMIGYDGLLRTLALGMITGLSSIGVSWYQNEDSEGLWLPKLNPIDPARITFETDKAGNNYPKLLTKRKSFQGIFIPYGSALIFRHWAVPNDSPYGYGLGRFLYFLVEWRREDLTYWLNIVDKYSDPLKVGTYPQSATEMEVEMFQDAIRKVASDGAMSMPEGFSLEILDQTTQPELVTELREFCSAAISKIITGEATIGEREVAGGQNRQTISNSIRVLKARSWSKTFDSFISSSLLKMFRDFNFPEARPPKLVTEWDNKEQLLNQIETLQRIGYNVSKEFIEEAFDLPQETEEEVEDNRPRIQFG